MLKALLKKQFLEIKAVYFRDKKTGKQRSKSGVIAYYLLFLFAYVSLAAGVVGIASTMADVFLPVGLGWLYYAVLGLMSILLGVLGSALSTYSSMYRAKDNDLLLSMPIPPGKILASRLVAVYAMGFLYESVVLVPAIIVYLTRVTMTIKNVLLPILLIFVVNFAVTALTCILGFLVALISGKVKHKSFITVLVSFALLAVYYVFCFNLNNYLILIAQNGDKVGKAVKTFVYPVYLLGRGMEGSVYEMLGFTAITGVITVITLWLLSGTFIGIATRNYSGAKTVYREREAKSMSHPAALLKKELRYFASNPVYIMNGALGSVFTMVGAVAGVIFMERVREVLVQMNIPADFYVVLAVCVVCMMASTNIISAPSVSLEGKNIWILQTMPVEPSDVLRAKKRLHEVITLPPVILFSVVISLIIKADILSAALIILVPAAYTVFFASLGVALNLKMPNLTWSSEAIPVKQGASTGICMLGGMGLSAVIGLSGYLLLGKIDTAVLLGLYGAAYILAWRLVDRWLYTRGAEIFAHL